MKEAIGKFRAAGGILRVDTSTPGGTGTPGARFEHRGSSSRPCPGTQSPTTSDLGRSYVSRLSGEAIGLNFGSTSQSCANGHYGEYPEGSA